MQNPPLLVEINNPYVPSDVHMDIRLTHACQTHIYPVCSGYLLGVCDYSGLSQLQWIVFLLEKLPPNSLNEVHISSFIKLSEGTTEICFHEYHVNCNSHFRVIATGRFVQNLSLTLGKFKSPTVSQNCYKGSEFLTSF